MINRNKTRKALIKRFVEKTIDISPEHWFSLKNLDYVPDHSYAFYQTLKSRFGIEPRNKAEVKYIRNIFHDIYINKYKGIYKLNLDKTFTSPLNFFIGVKKLIYYKKFVTKNNTKKKQFRLVKILIYT